jgi:ABC-type phosphate transport system substrate-binding protein
LGCGVGQRRERLKQGRAGAAYRRLSVAARLCVALLLAGCAQASPTPPPTPALVRVLATDLTEPLAWDLALAYAANNPAVVVAPALAAAGGLAAELEAGQAELALTVTPDPALFGTPVGYVPLSVVVNPANALETLPLAQAQALFEGRVLEWSALGAAGQPAGQGQVHVVARAPDSDAGRAWASQLWGEAAGTVMPNALVAPTWEAMAALVAEDPYAVGYVIGPVLDDRLKPLQLTDAEGQVVAMQLLVVAVAAGEPSGAARGFLAWAQGAAGQAVVAQRHTALAP